MATDEIPPEAGSKADSVGGGNVDLSTAKKRGRPAGGKNKPRANDEAGENASPLDAAFLSDAVVYFFETADAISARVALARIQKLFPEKLEEFEELQRQVALNQRDKDLIKKCVERIAIKYSLLTKFAPEILLIGVAVQYGMRQQRMFAAIEKLEKQMAIPIKVVPVTT